MTRRWPVIGVGLAVLWLFVRGVELTPLRILAELITGLLLGVPLAFALRRFYASEIAMGRTLRTLPACGAYVALFVRELLTANVEVAYRVLAPSLPIKPAVIELPLRVESDLAITTIANSITLTPGTLAMDYDEETNTIYVHAIDGRDREAVVEPIRAWEDYALRIFGEEADPSDPAPPRPGAGGPEDTADRDHSAGAEDGGETDG